MNEDILKKIKKCLALSKSSNENEAAIALKQAQTLMKQNNISLNDVEFSEIKKRTLITDLKRMRFVEVRLAQMVAGIFECGFLIDENKNFIFYGIEPNTEIAEYAYGVLLPSLKKARKEYVSGLHGNTKLKSKRSLGDTFCMGWIFSVKTKCAAIHPNKKMDDLLNRFKKEFFNPKEFKFKESKFKNKDKLFKAHIAGCKASESIQVFHAMGNEKQNQIGQFKAN